MIRYLAACERFWGDAPGGGSKIAWELANLVRATGGEVALLCGSVAGDPPEGLSVVDGIQKLITQHLTLARYQNCTTCHVRIHGSNAHPFFFR